jgi:hypothetical protein
MFGFRRTEDPRSPSAAMSQIIERSGPPVGVGHASMLRVVESRGRYSGRTVRYVRIFDPTRAAEAAVVVRRYGDLDAHPGLVLWSGHVESDGTVAITRNAAAVENGAPTRVHADRAGHADDERFVFQGRDAAATGVAS